LEPLTAFVEWSEMLESLATFFVFLLAAFCFATATLASTFLGLRTRSFEQLKATAALPSGTLTDK
jgi:hypothetical protein